jgi:peptidoglycan/xylan/chitin deacetylase (PgdA/CDA1 family)
MRVIVTIDTEGHDGMDPVEHLIWGKCSDGTYHGIDEIMDILDNNNATGLFFLDFAEAWDYGEDKIKIIALHIKERGHNVGMHIHPDHMADPKRLFLYEYNREEQYEIIKKCTDLYVKILGERPESFRAGKYAADRNTLNIIKELGYKYDFSEFYGQKWCGINPPVTINKTRYLENGILEIPVLSYKSFELGPYSRCDKLDTDMNYLEFEYVINRVNQNMCIDPIVMFIHSFSLLKWRRNPDNPVYNKRKANELKKMISILNRKSFMYIKESNLDNWEENKEMDKLLDLSKGFNAYIFFILRAIKVLRMRLRL